jgi:hypothetical protein
MADGRGLYMLITPAGGKLWRWKYRFEGAEKLMSFGRYPDVSLEPRAKMMQHWADFLEQTQRGGKVRGRYETVP